MPGVRDTINCSFSACRIGLRKCWQWALCHKPIIFVLHDQYNVICLGLNGSGKTTLLKSLTEDNFNQQDIQPTNGFYIKTLPIRNIVLSIKEIGGLDRLRKFWPNYFENKQAILYVLDASDNDENLNKSCETLKQILKDERLKDKPCLILGTHADLSHSKDDSELKLIFQNLIGNLLNDRKWSLHLVQSFNKNQVQEAIEILIDLMLNN